MFAQRIDALVTMSVNTSTVARMAYHKEKLNALAAKSDAASAAT